MSDSKQRAANPALRPKSDSEPEYWDLRLNAHGTPHYRIPPDPHLVWSSVVALLYLIAAALAGGLVGVARMIGFLLLPLLCIWFPGILGTLTTGLPSLGGRPITRGSPPSLVRWVGWLAFLGPVVGSFYGAFSG
jgi:amino acid permease